ncbi:FAD:protein FMN transferase [bacterium]|nr:FAD:protein FMN transferase [bacterium]
MKTIIVFFLLFPSLVFAKTYSRTQILMGNVPVSITIRDSKTSQNQVFSAMNNAFSKVYEVEKQVSQYISSSPVNRIQNSTRWHSVPNHLWKLIGYSLELSQNTNGAFDITYASTNKSATYRDIQINEEHHAVRLLKPGMHLYVLGVAKGYIVDAMSQELSEKGYKHHIINAGGDIYASGTWSIQIRNPSQPNNALSKKIRVTNKGVSTSGLYERGKHIYDPKTKKPYLADGSITIIAPSATLSDGLDNAAFVLGEKAEEIIRNNYPQVKIIKTQYRAISSQ